MTQNFMLVNNYKMMTIERYKYRKFVDRVITGVLVA